jgi:hypothetical protein
MPADRATRKAFQIGRAQAREVLKFRARALRKRAAALKAKPKGLQSQRTVEVDKALLRESAMLGPPVYWSPKVTPGPRTITAPGFNDQVVSGIIDQRVKIAYVTILSAVTQICEERLNRKLPILVHGYDYPVADGRGFAGGWGFCPALGWNQASAKKVSAT